MRSANWLLVALLYTLVATGSEAEAASGRLYGTVHVDDGSTITGALRWDDQEVYWSDHFNGDKPAPPDLSELSDDEREEIEENQPGPQFDFNGTTVELIKLFGRSELRPQEARIEFGAIAEVINEGGGRATLVLRDGSKIEIDGGSDDVSPDVQVRSDEGAEHEIDWSDIDKVVFAEEPAGAKRFEPHLWGRVESDAGEFTGVVQWDHDERYLSERLDADMDGEDLSFDFSSILTIERDGDGAQVTFREGDPRYLTGTNDVNDENRGVYVDVPGIGRVDIPWDRFERLDLMTEPEDQPGYAVWQPVGLLRGTVVTVDGESVAGELLYDLDEGTGAEMIDGRDENDVRYFIPLRNVKTIRPGERASEVTLRNGQTLTLSASRDVNDSNNGTIVRGEGGPRYLSWGRIREIRFD